MSDQPIEVLAYYFPSYHQDDRNDAWHGKGWTEWALVRGAKSRYPGHRQPIEPAWGEFDESDPTWAAREIDLAANYGITGFVYDWYWYEDGPYLEGGLEKGFLNAPNNERLKFALMWANHDWINIHPVNALNKPAVLAPGRVSSAAFERMTDHAIKHYFSRPNYLRIDGAPYFSIYELGTFIAGLGGLEAAREALEGFRERARAAGLADVHLNAVVWGMSILPSEIKLEHPSEAVAALGLNSVTTYAWVHDYDPNSGTFPHGSYAAAAQRAFTVWEEHAKDFGVPYHPNVSMGWDPSPRTTPTDTFEPRGYPWHAVLEGNTPEAFRAALERARNHVERSSSEQKIITINAWNEWTEGSYLLPDTVYGNAYLEAIREVFAAQAVAADD